jgi:hypothetical protein
VGPYDQGLFYVGGFGGAGDEDAKGIWAPMKSFVGLVEIVHDLMGWNDQDQMLRDDEDGPVGRQGFAGNPDGGVFGYSELAWNDGYINAFEVVRVFDRAQVNVP